MCEAPLDPSWFFSYVFYWNCSWFLLVCLLLELYLVLLPDFIQIHWGGGQFCFFFLARNHLTQKVLWEERHGKEQIQPHLGWWRKKKRDRLTDVKQYQFIMLQFLEIWVQNRFTGLKSRCQQGSFPYKRLERRNCLLAFFSFWRCLHSLAHDSSFAWVPLPPLPPMSHHIFSLWPSCLPLKHPGAASDPPR